MNFNEYLVLYAKTIMFFQLIEENIKWIYASMLRGDPIETKENIKNMTLGQIVDKLKKLDCEDDDLLISKNDYNFLQQLTQNRNYWVHENFIKILNEKDNYKTYNKNYYLSEKKLLKAFKKAEIVKDNILQIKKEIIRHK